MPLPSTLPVGRGTAVLCLGACFHPREPLRRLRLLVDGQPREPDAWRMPRLDLFRAMPAELGNSYRSGFWAVVPLEPRDRPGTLRIDLAAELASGARIVAPFGKVEVIEPSVPGHGRGRPGVPGLIAVCMATFEPDMALFEAQLDSLRTQTDRHWTCVISDDCSHEGRFERIAQAVADDARFTLSRSPERLGAYRNFERALGMVPQDADLVALCDQDDRWHPDKLASLRAALGGAELVYSDQRVVARDGRVLRESLWTGRRNEHSNIASLLVANAVAGAAALFRREVAELAVPFPEAPGWQFHDHWIALVALARGRIAYLDRPLYDYVQHESAVVGKAAGTGARMSRPPGSRGWRAAYFYGYLPRRVQAEALLVRCAQLLSGPKRRALGRFAAADRSPPALAWLAARPLRRLVRRGETLGTESELARGVVWRHLIRMRAARRERPEGSPYDASCPPLDAGSLGQERLGRWLAGD